MMPDGFLRNFGEPVMHRIEPAPGVVVHLPNPATTITTTSSGATVQKTDDGGSLVDLNPQPVAAPGSQGWDENLALHMGDIALDAIASDLAQGIDADINSRAEWQQAYDKGLDLLGIKLQEPTAVPTQGQIAGISTICNPALLEAVIRFQAGAMGELLPAGGPVKVEVDADETAETDDLADDLESDLNHYLTQVDEDYYPDTIRGLFHVGFYGGVAKKVYRCPILRRPVSRCVYLYDLIISQEAITIQTAARVTHRAQMRTNVMKRLMRQGFWRDTPIAPPSMSVQSPAQKEKQLQGIQATIDRAQDREHTIWECYCDLEIATFGGHDPQAPDGLAVPYVVTIERDSRKMLALRRNWKKGDETQRAQRPFVLYPYLLGIGFYPIGLVHILGNSTRTLTAIDREAVDAGMFANFPGGAISKDVARQETNEMRSGPGGFRQIDTGGQDIRAVLMAWPYKDVTPGLLALREKIMEETSRLGGSATMPIGEGRPDIPVGTMLAMIEQAVKPEAAVHKLLHTAQSKEFRLLRDLFREDPQALWREAENPARKWMTAAELGDFRLVPVADPNVPTQMHRVMQIMALIQLYQLFQGKIDPDALLTRALHVLGVKDTTGLVVPGQPQSQDQGAAGLAGLLGKQQPSPAQDAAAVIKAQATMATVNQKEQDSQRKAANEAVQAQADARKDQSAQAIEAADLASRERIANTELEIERERLEIEKAREERERIVAAASLEQAHRQQGGFGQPAGQAGVP